MLLPTMSAGRARRPLSPETLAAITVSVRSPGVPRPSARLARPRVSAKAAARRSRASMKTGAVKIYAAALSCR
jgi:hypothetical protein